ncbi:hypothetical protein PHYBLDRAFT_145079 [Phycomyces blakesleeanus NRRL 1555(-)]|uniref:FAR1 domain-containing protein n=1 Tax=Phycomyces blakesleeanus (strain ATCC 8743b / DSM 1359 / FGSC 10004 / NBRC 33097 / NRRL 1555) TaxID=763407 RepID=A0A162UAA4_PHYB8|nr:hypothetical protein PHYBLDRAFT_145079 [Phycomyces blakesleeanus NRRL 1555(-)]OAD73603.1 hypothetical protein PHYBLDRAFT_145079 [Phycomyces blakesleeanus NRRL 1555(-)]|eukprot:XP_018291643.1 hypothetical protein PHYBLDRAFT_145079 [Phycomyces blakesleeanus NRRL 1555(-)]
MSIEKRTNFTINEIDDYHMLRNDPDYEIVNPKIIEIFINEDAFTLWYETSAKRHSHWNISNTSISKATYSTASPSDVVKTIYFVCKHAGMPRKAKPEENCGLERKPKRIRKESIKDGCKAKITKKTLRNGRVAVEYMWHHATHQPEKNLAMGSGCGREAAEVARNDLRCLEMQESIGKDLSVLISLVKDKIKDSKSKLDSLNMLSDQLGVCISKVEKIGTALQQQQPKEK